MKSKLEVTVVCSEQEKIYRKQVYDDVSKVLNCRLCCTCCLKDVKNDVLIKDKVYIHPFFQVLVCKECLKFYGGGEISQDDDGFDKYCRWCGQGGLLNTCSECSVAICKSCINRNLSRAFRKEVEKDDWKCFRCQPKPLYELRAQAWAIKSWLKSKKQSKKPVKEKPKAPDTTLEGQLLNGLDYELGLVKEVQKACRSTDMKLGGICRRKELVNKTNLTFEKVNNVSLEISNNIETLISKLDSYKKNLASFFTSLKETVDKLPNDSVGGSAEANNEAVKTVSKRRLTSDNTSDVSNKIKKKETGSTISKNKERVLSDNDSNSNNGNKTDSISNCVVNGSSITDIDELFSEEESQDSQGGEDNVAPTATSEGDSPKEADSNKETKDGDNYEIKTEIFPKLTLRIRKVEEVNKALLKDQETIQTSLSAQCDIIELEDDEESPETVSNTDTAVSTKDNQKENNDQSNSKLIAEDQDSNDTDSEKASNTSNVTMNGKKVDKGETKKSSPIRSADNFPISDNSKDDDEALSKKNTSAKTKSTEKEDKENVEIVPNASMDLFSDQGDTDEAQVISSTSESSPDEGNSRLQETKSKPTSGQNQNSAKKKMKSSSDSDSDIERLLDMKSLNSNKKKSKKKEKSNVKKEMESTAKNSKKISKQKSILDYFDEDSDDSVIDLRAELFGSVDMKSLDRDSMYKMLIMDQFHIQREASLSLSSELSDSRKSISSDNSDDIDDLLRDSDDERKEKRKKSKKKNDHPQAKEEDNSDDSENVKDSKSSKWKKDKLLTMKLSDDSDSSDIFQKKSTEKKSDKRAKKKVNLVLDSDEEKEAKTRKNSSESSDSEVSEDDTPKKKRKRIKNASSSSDEDGGLEGSGGKGHRKNIRKVLKKDNLQESTQNALIEEENRKKRIIERQRLYNQMIEECETFSNKVEKLVLDFDVDTKEELLSVDKDLVAKLKPHQAEGIKFMWDSSFETLKKAKKNKGSGCILAHCMGLGKTLQVISLIHTLLTNDVGVKCALVLCPLSTVLNWVNEFEKWLSDVGSGQDVDVFHLTKVNAQYRASQLREWQRRGGVMVLAYNLFRLLVNPTRKLKAAHRTAYFETLCDPGSDIVFCDEGHLLKNEKTALSNAVGKIKTLRRIVLTGTPLQNNLIEYHCMMQFVKPNLLGTKKEFVNRFVSPIENGQFVDSTPHDVKVMKRRAHVLHKMLDGLVQRKAYNVLIPFLPNKQEYVLSLSLTEVQVNLYHHYLNNLARNKSGTGVGTSLFKDRNMLSLICAHPRLIVVHNENELMKRELEFSDEEGSLKDFIDDSSESSTSTSESSSQDSDSSSSIKMVSKKRTRSALVDQDTPQEEVTEKDDNWWSSIIKEGDMEDIGTSSKLLLFFTILQKCEEIGDKLLLFSQSLLVLDLIEYFLDKVDSQSQTQEELPLGLRGFSGSWASGIDYFRLDGKTSSENRANWCRRFNNEDNLRGRLFLISTRAGGLGINLTGANRVILFDASWNPSHDVQSIFRVFRFGQTKPCYIYRFLNKGTMEQKVYDRQVTKLSMSCRVIDEQQIDRHFSFADLNELYTFTPNERDEQTPSLPKDRMLAELLQEHKDLVLGYITHDSLLENQLDEELNEEERKQAWADFEQEKNPPPSETLNNYAETYQRVFKTLKEKYPTWSDMDVRQAVFTIISRMNAMSGGNVIQGHQMQVGQQQFMQLQNQQLQNQQLQNQQLSRPQFMNYPQVVPRIQSNLPRMMNNMQFGNQALAGKQWQSVNTPISNVRQSIGTNTFFGNVQQPNMLPNPYAVAGNKALPNPFTPPPFNPMTKQSGVVNNTVSPAPAAAPAATPSTSSTKQPEQ